MNFKDVKNVRIANSEIKKIMHYGSEIWSGEKLLLDFHNEFDGWFPNPNSQNYSMVRDPEEGFSIIPNNIILYRYKAKLNTLYRVIVRARGEYKNNSYPVLVVSINDNYSDNKTTSLNWDDYTSDIYVTKNSYDYILIGFVKGKGKSQRISRIRIIEL